MAAVFGVVNFELLVASYSPRSAFRGEDVLAVDSTLLLGRWLRRDLTRSERDVKTVLLPYNVVMFARLARRSRVTRCQIDRDSRDKSALLQPDPTASARKEMRSRVVGAEIACDHMLSDAHLFGGHPEGNQIYLSSRRRYGAQQDVMHAVGVGRSEGQSHAPAGRVSDCLGINTATTFSSRACQARDTV